MPGEKFATGEEFLNWFEGVHHIENAEWVVKGDPLDAMEVDVKITADGETKTIYFGAPILAEKTGWHNKVILCMIANKVMKQGDLHVTYDVGSNEVDMVNFMREVLNGGDP